MDKIEKILKTPPKLKQSDAISEIIANLHKLYRWGFYLKMESNRLEHETLCMLYPCTECIGKWSRYQITEDDFYNKQSTFGLPYVEIGEIYNN